MGSKRKRVSKKFAQDNARKGVGGGANWLNLPEGVEEWKPESKGVYPLNVLPYETTDENHPDGVEPKTVWWKRSFIIHRSVGPENRSVVCPHSVGKKCPIHEQLPNVEKDNEINEKDKAEMTRKLRGQNFTMMNIENPEDSDKVSIFTFPSFNFYSGREGEPCLSKEVDENEDLATFWDVKDGKTLKVKFSEASFSGTKFLKASRFDFEDREDLDEEDVLGKTVNLDKVLNILPYDKLKSMLNQDDDESTEEEDEEAAPEDSDDEDEEENSDDEDEEDEEEDDSASDDDDEEESEDDGEEKAPKSKVKVKNKTKSGGSKK